MCYYTGFQSLVKEYFYSIELSLNKHVSLLPLLMTAAWTRREYTWVTRVPARASTQNYLSQRDLPVHSTSTSYHRHCACLLGNRGSKLPALSWWPKGEVGLGRANVYLPAGGEVLTHYEQTLRKQRVHLSKVTKRHWGTAQSPSAAHKLASYTPMLTMPPRFEQAGKKGNFTEAHAQEVR